MSMKMRFEDTDKLEVVLGSIIKDCENAGLEAQKECAQIAKKAVVRRLEKIKTSQDENEEIVTHMCNDVQIKTTKDRFGDNIVKLQGGKKTGTLWHLVNDGTYRSDPTHFMDLALNDAEEDFNNAIEEKLRGVLDD